MSGGEAWVSLGNAVFTILLARELGVATFGIFISLTTLWDLFRGLVSQGLNVLLVRDVAQDRERTSLYWSNGMLLTFLLTLVAAGGVFLTAQTDIYAASAVQACLVVALALFPATGAILYEALFIANERMEFITGMNVVETLVRIALSLILLWRGMGLASLIGAIVVSQAVMVIGYHILFTRVVYRLHWKPDLAFARKLARGGAVLTVQSALATISSRAGILILTALSGPIEVGLYAAAGKLTRLSLILDAYRDSIFPNMSRLTDAPDQAFRQVLEKSFKYLVIAFLPVCIGITILADRFILLIYTPEFSGAAIMLQIIIWSLMMKIFSPILSRALIAFGRQDLALRVSTVSLVLGLILTIAFVPRWGAIGMMVGGYISDLLGLALLHRYLAARNVHIRYGRILIRPALAGIVMGIATYLMHDMNLFLVIPVSALIYGIALLVFRVVTPQEWSLIWQVGRAGMGRVARLLPTNTITE